MYSDKDNRSETEASQDHDGNDQKKSALNFSRSRVCCIFTYHQTPLTMQKISKPIPRSVVLKRMLKSMLFSFFILFVSLSAGTIGYKETIPEFDWYDSLLNASMILSGMGPIVDPHIVMTNTSKVFASFYAIYSGIAFIGTIGILIAPIAHSFFHRIHIEDENS